MRRFLIVANQTLGGEDLMRKVAEVLAHGQCSFYVVVPATRDPNHRLLWTEGQSNALARRHLDEARQRLGAMGAEVDGEVGDPSALIAIADVLRTRQFEEIILSTLPSGASRWLLQDLPRRVRAAFPGPVSVVVAARQPASEPVIDLRDQPVEEPSASFESAEGFQTRPATG
jgi:hypothetical protein